MPTPTDTTNPTTPDPLDQLVPAPRRWWIRLLLASIAIALVTVGSIGYGFGYLVPRPECCGSGSGSTPMSLTTDGEAVMIWAYFFNSSGRDLRITGAHAALPGATVRSTGMVDAEVPPLMPSDPAPLPAVVGGHEMVRVAIAFTPDACTDDRGPWGSLTLDLEVVNSRWPSFDRSFTLPDPIVDDGTNPLSVYGPADVEVEDGMGPLAAACALLGVDPT